MNGPGASSQGLVIYTRRDCSLCDRMTAGVRRVIGPGREVVLVEIDDDEELVRRFGPDIPVLCLDGEVICKHFLQAERLAAALRGARQDGGRPAPL